MKSNIGTIVNEQRGIMCILLRKKSRHGGLIYSSLSTSSSDLEVFLG